MNSSIAHRLADGRPCLQNTSSLTTLVISDGIPEIDHFNESVTMETV